MAKVLDEIDGALKAFIEQQTVFFLGSAPLDGHGHVNLSPRGLDSLRVLGPRRVVVLDLTGSGNETAAHLRENGRVTVMLCAFSGKPKILRLYGRGRVLPRGSAAFVELSGHFPDLPGARQMFDIAVERIQTSCGFGVPEGDLKPRQTLIDWATRKGEAGLADYWATKNARSIDGLPTGIEATLAGASLGAMSAPAAVKSGATPGGADQPAVGDVAYSEKCENAAGPVALDHVSLAVRDLEASVVFYRDAVGLRPVARPDLGFPGAWFDLGSGRTLHLLADPAVSETQGAACLEGPPGRCSHFAVRVSAWAERVEGLKRAGRTVVASRSGRPAAFVADPDGHWVELIDYGVQGAA